MIRLKIDKEDLLHAIGNLGEIFLEIYEEREWEVDINYSYGSEHLPFFAFIIANKENEITMEKLRQVLQFCSGNYKVNPTRAGFIIQEYTQLKKDILVLKISGNGTE